VAYKDIIIYLPKSWWVALSWPFWPGVSDIFCREKLV